MRKKLVACVGLAAAGLWLPQAAAGADPASTTTPTLAQLFGQRQPVRSVSLSPDGKHVVVVTPGPGQVSYAAIVDVDTMETTLAGKEDGKPLHMQRCGWSSNTRIVCQEAGMLFAHDPPVGYTRTISVDMDGKNPAYVGRRSHGQVLRGTQYDGNIIDWLDGDGTILMSRDYAPETSNGGSIVDAPDGLGVDRVDTRTGHGMTVEQPDRETVDFLSDGQGNVRIRATAEHDGNGNLTGGMIYVYRQAGSRQWHSFSHTKPHGQDLTPVAVDGTRNLAYATRPLNGRDALYSVALDGSMKTDLVVSNLDVDVDDVVTIGRHGRVIGVAYTTDRRHVEYFDPDYARLATALARVLPDTPLIDFLSASADERRLLVFAASDTDAGHYYVFDRPTHHLSEILEARPLLDGRRMAAMKSISFTAADGTAIPAYLTLPLEGAGRNLPTIVMPHGGPDYRDAWGFDWLVQYFAQRGYAVLQPEYRGSAGYGDAFYLKNGFHSWQVAMGDVVDAGRWLVKEGIADPNKLAIVGWSYGGYAALQANVVEPNLFKAIVAVAPVTDLAMAKTESFGYTTFRLVTEQIGSGDSVAQGSPARHADRIVAPVLMFHGDHDTNVRVAESQVMDAALHRAGKQSTLVVFPGLDHQLDDADARTQLLDQADHFLRTAMKM